MPQILKRPRDKFGTSQGHPGRLGRFMWKFKEQNVRKTDGTYDETDETCPRDRRDTHEGVSRLKSLCLLGFLSPLKERTASKFRKATKERVWEASMHLERPCASQEGASMLLRRAGGFLRREGGFLRRGRGSQEGLFSKGNKRWAASWGRFLRTLRRSLRSSTPSRRPSLCLPEERQGKKGLGTVTEASMHAWQASTKSPTRLNASHLRCKL